MFVFSFNLTGLRWRYARVFLRAAAHPPPLRVPPMISVSLGRVIYQTVAALQRYTRARRPVEDRSVFSSSALLKRDVMAVKHQTKPLQNNKYLLLLFLLEPLILDNEVLLSNHSHCPQPHRLISHNYCNWIPKQNITFGIGIVIMVFVVCSAVFLLPLTNLAYEWEGSAHIAWSSSQNNFTIIAFNEGSCLME